MRVLSPTGGHADLHMYPHDWVCDFADRVGILRQCDGVAECLRAVRLQLRDGARLIKICASGGVMSEIDHPIHQQFGADELRAIVEEAALADRVVAAHCHGKPGIMAALAAGVRTIEHGTYLDEEAASAMVESGAILVPTRHIVEEFLATAPPTGSPSTRSASWRRSPTSTRRPSRSPTSTGSGSPRGPTSPAPRRSRPRAGGRTAPSSATWWPRA